jgi:uncharacterized protein
MRRLTALLLFLAALASAQVFDMTTYYMVFLKKGANPQNLSKEDAAKAQKDHLANIQKMFDDGKLVIAGPFTDNGDIRGIFILKVGSMDEAKALAAEDPAVKAGLLVLEVHPWYAAKGLSIPAPKK